MPWSAAVAAGYAAPIWMTYRQEREIGGQVRKGETGSLVVFASTITRAGTDESTGEETEQDIPFMKGYTVFNVEQIDGLPAHFHAPAAPRLDPAQRIDQAEAFFSATGASIRHGGNMAFYSVTEDRVQMPPFETFKDAESYYATLAHKSLIGPARRREQPFCCATHRSHSRGRPAGCRPRRGCRACRLRCVRHALGRA